MSDLIRLCGLLHDALPAGDLRDRVDAIARTDQQPVRIGVIGRVGTGKSTLVNAVLGRPVAATAAEDCTRYPTVYSYGAPENAVALGVDGRRTPLPLDLSLGEPPSDTVKVEVTLQTAVLRRITVVDFPGLAATPDAPDTPRATELVEGCEILLYLFRGQLRADDERVIADHAAASHALAEGALPTVGVLAHADNFGPGGWAEEDSIELAAASCRARLTATNGRFHQVVALSPLMAETVRTGRVTEGVARRLRALRDADPLLLQFGAGAPESDPSAVADLTALLTGYAVNRGRVHGGSSHVLSEWMLERSGYQALMRAFDGLQPIVSRIRLSRALQDLNALLRAPGVPRPAQALLEREMLGATGHAARELRALRLLAAEQPDHELVGVLRTLMNATTTRERLTALVTGSEGAWPADPIRWCRAQASRYQALAGFGGSGAETEAARTLSMSFLYLAGHP
ncbi:dynamin family protein [Granulicoccus sp. GXG6511]|uniref:dynamin family protein n=1 Tax=Granulicoccus sp. GXG6511 TaxID=3381351 RepID=UPI003D7CDC68